jgi:hypothetical protein
MPKYTKKTNIQKPEFEVKGEEIFIKNLVIPIVPQSFDIGSEEFEKYCFDNFEYFISPFSGKYQLLRINYSNLKSIVEIETKTKANNAGISSESLFYQELKQSIENTLFGSIALETEACCLQIVEMFLRLIISLESNKGLELFWAPYMFCNNKDFTEYKPNSIEGFLDTIYKSKDFNKAIGNNFDLKYILFKDYDYGYVKNQVQFKVIKKYFSKILVQVIARFKNNHPYNQYKHGSRTYAKKIKLKLNYHYDIESYDEKIDHGNLKPFTLFSTWEIDKEKKKVIENIATGDIEQDLIFCNKVMEIMLHIIMVHNHELYFKKPLVESEIKKWW